MTNIKHEKTWAALLFGSWTWMMASSLTIWWGVEPITARALTLIPIAGPVCAVFALFCKANWKEITK